MTTETTKTGTHEFRIFPCRGRLPEGVQAWEVEYRALNKKTGLPWQAPRRVTDLADVEPEGWKDRPIAYSTLAAARLAMSRQRTKLAKG